VDYDHPTFLGDTVEQIAGEKAGILKSGVPAVFARQRPEAARVIEGRARELDIPFIREEDAEVTNVRVTARGSRFVLDGRPVECPLAGEHQVGNAVTAALALRHLGYSAEGIAGTRWPGRLEFVAERPDIVLDGAHNVAGTRALTAYIRRFHAGRSVHLIYGAVRDKPVREMTAELFPLASDIIVTAPANSRAMPPEEAVSCAPAQSAIRTAADIAGALDMVRQAAGPEDVIFIAGSLYLVGDARRLLVK
jgi:dihydrofolate synthase/folylpolyglutamate synthase